ncbi:MAG: hypothetical protein JWN94_2457 [Betaproteobacteria bacterium]|nr:hypothetical protein [Betaproteobacteria bacterium]
MLKKALKVGAFAAALALPGLAAAQAAPAAKPEEAKPPYTLTGNVGLFSQYIFRGLSQTGRKPAVQGGFDYAHESGFYAGTWASNISWLKENATNAVPGTVQGTYGEGGSMEMDFYGGYKWNLPNDFVVDLGTLYYWYPGSINTNLTAAPTGTPKADTWELYVAPSWKWVTLKYSYSLKSDTFGVKDSKGTSYLDLSAAYPIPDTGFTLIGHWGWQKYRGTSSLNPTTVPGGRLASNDSLFTYKDVKLGASYALPKDFTVGAYWTKLFNYNKAGYGGIGDGVTGLSATSGPFPNDIGKSTGTIYVQKTF